MAKSTHRGTCQICHRLQMLPGGRLAKHGYMVDSGFFHGVCHGARQLPLEQSCECVKEDIARCEASIDDLASRMKKLMERPVEPVAYYQVYSRHRRLWVTGKVVMIAGHVQRRPNGRRTGGFLVFEADAVFALGNAEGAVKLQIRDIGYAQDPIEAAWHLNKVYAESVLKNKFKGLLMHLDRQKEVVASWVPKDLVEVV